MSSSYTPRFLLLLLLLSPTPSAAPPLLSPFSTHPRHPFRPSICSFPVFFLALVSFLFLIFSTSNSPLFIFFFFLPVAPFLLPLSGCSPLPICGPSRSVPFRSFLSSLSSSSSSS